MSYITTEQAKAYIGGISGGGDDALLADIIAQAEAFIEGYTERDFEATAANRSFDSSADVEGSILWVEDVGDLASISTITNGDGTSVASTKYTTIPANAVAKGVPIRGIKLLPSADISWEAQDDGDTANAITVNGVWAWSATAPTRIKQACYNIVKTIYRSRDANADPGATFISGGVVIRPETLDSMTKAILDSYRRRT